VNAISDEDFKQIVLDFINMVTTQRHREIITIMTTSNQNVMDEIIKLTAAHTQLETTVKTAIADMGTGGDAARAGFVTALQAAQAQIAATETELTAAIAAVTTAASAAPVA
jgi:hypothetical protein